MFTKHSSPVRGENDQVQSIPTPTSDQPRDTIIVESAESCKFYGSSVNEAYRLKSELLARHMTEIGFGKSVDASFVW